MANDAEKQLLPWQRTEAATTSCTAASPVNASLALVNGLGEPHLNSDTYANIGSAPETRAPGSTSGPTAETSTALARSLNVCSAQMDED